MFEERGFKSPPDDPEPRPKDPDNPTSAELEEHLGWVRHHYDELQPYFRAKPDPFDDEAQALARERRRLNAARSRRRRPPK
jgi:hypothetical protein